MTDDYSKLTKRDIKHSVQNTLMHHMMSAFYELGDQGAPEHVIAEARKQVARVERIFGYTPYSWKA